MPYKKFNPTLITVTNNPFYKQRATRIPTGCFMKNTDQLDNNNYRIEAMAPVEIGMLKELNERVGDILNTGEPENILLLADYGQGKSFAMKAIQDELFRRNRAIISLTCTGLQSIYNENDDSFPEKILGFVEKIFNALDEDEYPQKTKLKNDLNLSGSHTFEEFIALYDNVYSQLNIPVFIFIDELDKIITSNFTDEQKSRFLNVLKTIAEACNESISLFVAGSPNCKTKMDDLGIDYAPRFYRIDSNLLNKDKTKQYIIEICKKELQYNGYVPFDTYVINEIAELSKGNIRNINRICNDLWRYSANRKEKITKTNFEYFIIENSYQHIQTVVGSIDDAIIKFIALLLANNGRISIVRYKKEFRDREKRKIMDFINNNGNVITTIKKSYKIDVNLYDRILKQIRWE